MIRSKNMVKKAQNAENYDQLNKITEFIEEHEDKLKEMDYANAVKMLKNIRE
jgi:putative IMPACT (imprinted ancient) family translation regulator